MSGMPLEHPDWLERIATLSNQASRLAGADSDAIQPSTRGCSSGTFRCRQTTPTSFVVMRGMISGTSGSREGV
jgi:hypothetical protein